MFHDFCVGPGLLLNVFFPKTGVISRPGGMIWRNGRENPIGCLRTNVETAMWDDIDIQSNTAHIGIGHTIFRKFTAWVCPRTLGCLQHMTAFNRIVRYSIFREPRGVKLMDLSFLLKIHVDLELGGVTTFFSDVGKVWSAIPFSKT